MKGKDVRAFFCAVGFLPGLLVVHQQVDGG
jgi:hypothetical protein